MAHLLQMRQLIFLIHRFFYRLKQLEADLIFYILCLGHDRILISVEPDLDRAVNQLQELWQKGFIAQPEYTSEETVTDVSAWTFTCRIPEKVEAIGTASTKQAAKKQAAYNAYCALIGR